ncbi:MAG TPA: methyltransferase domain-containing protein [Candidatus Dormibacteraeota bacterium]
MSAAEVETPAERWRAALAEWAIPAEILDAAPESPWRLRPQQFAARADRAMAEHTPTPSRARELEALPDDGTVLDIGVGAGAASLPLLTRASRLIAVDGDPAMLDELRARMPADVELSVVQGMWPDVADSVDDADVVICHHVAYNVPNLDAAVRRMTEKARRRVVMELTSVHPRTPQNFLWPIFHGIDRPARPTASDAIDVIRACGFAPHFDEWKRRELLIAAEDLPELVASMRRYLCLTPDRDPEIERALAGHLVRRDGQVGLPALPVVTVWWDAPHPAQ